MKSIKDKKPRKNSIPQLAYMVRTLGDYQRTTDAKDTKRFVYMNAIRAIKEGVSSGKDNVPLCQLKGSNASILIPRSDWRVALTRAMNFLSKLEYYETCQTCKELLEVLDENQ